MSGEPQGVATLATRVLLIPHPPSLTTRRSAAWSARSVRDREVVGSNPTVSTATARPLKPIAVKAPEVSRSVLADCAGGASPLGPLVRSYSAQTNWYDSRSDEAQVTAFVRRTAIDPVSPHRPNALAGADTDAITGTSPGVGRVSGGHEVPSPTLGYPTHMAWRNRR